MILHLKDNMLIQEGSSSENCLKACLE
jgi:hypothetical protein